MAWKRRWQCPLFAKVDHCSRESTLQRLLPVVIEQRTHAVQHKAVAELREHGLRAGRLSEVRRPLAPREAAWEHADGKGADIKLDAFPVNGRVVLREPQER